MTELELVVKDYILPFIAGVLFGGFIFSMTYIYQIDKANTTFKQLAIEASCAYYDPKTGDFTWINQ